MKEYTVKSPEEKYESLKALLSESADSVNAGEMSAYMKNRFVFYGIPAPRRKEICSGFIRDEKRAGIVDWDFLDICFSDPHRELQYFVSDCLLAMKRLVRYEDVFHIREYVTCRSWWDTVDFLCKVIGDAGLRDLRVGRLMLEWSEDGNVWVKRAAVLHQLGLRDKTDTALLERIAANCFGTGEFFVNKAVGWALRDYSKTDPEFVRAFIERNRDRMDGLSLREASKYL